MAESGIIATGSPPQAHPPTHLSVLLSDGQCLVIRPQFLEALLCQVLLFHVAGHISKDSLHFGPAEEVGVQFGNYWTGWGGPKHCSKAEPHRDTGTKEFRDPSIGLWSPSLANTPILV